MDALRIEATLDTPKVFLDPNSPRFEISGKSFPADVTYFYQPVMSWIERYSKTPNVKTVFDVKLDYFNTASSKVLLDILYKLEEIHGSGKPVTVRWYYPDDDEDMEETGIEFARILKLPFEHISYSVQIK